jgi:hypothetical protein
MTTQNKTARLAGLLYLILVVSGVLNLLYIPSKLIDWKDAAKTVENITNSEMLFKLGILSGIIAFMAFLFLSLVLYKLFREVNKTQASLMVILVLVSIPISFTNMLHNFSVLTLISKPDYLHGWDTAQLQSQVMLHLGYFNNGIELSGIFWGLWLFPFGNLVYRSGFLPKILGIFLMAGCFGYLIEFAGHFLFSNDYSNSIISTIAGLPGTIGEFGICLWLLIMGTKKSNAAADSPAYTV